MGIELHPQNHKSCALMALPPSQKSIGVKWILDSIIPHRCPAES